MAQQVKNPTSVREDVGSIPGLLQWVKDLVLLQAVVEVTDLVWSWRCSGCGVGWQLHRQFDPQPGNNNKKK